MKRRTWLFVLWVAFSALPAHAQNTPAVDDLLKRLEAIGQEAATLRAPATSTQTVAVPPGVDTLQRAVFAAQPGMTLQLQAGGVYTGSVIVPKVIHDLTITTQGFMIGDRAVRPTDVASMAIIQPTPNESYGLWILGSAITVRGVIFAPTSSGQGEMVRVGDATSPVLADVPDAVTLAQNYFRGDPGNVFGQKRGLAANGSHLVIDQNYMDNIWVQGQDSQGVAVFSTPGPVKIRRNIIAAGSENVLIGGVPPAGPAFIPSDVDVEDNVLWKPLAWKGATPARVVKNLFEIKIGHRIHARRNWMETHWQQAQPGPAVVLTMATNGTCSYCDGQDWLFEDNVVWNVSAGVNVTGYQYSYAPGAGQATGVVIRNNLFYITKATMGGNGRPLIMSNEPKALTVDANTFIHDGSAVVAADYGTKWPFQSPPLPGSIAAGPLQGFVFTHNLSSPASYGIFTPEGTNGVQVGVYFPGAVIGGNVWLGAPAAALARYDAFMGAAGPNQGGSAVLAPSGCPAPMSGAGADCARLPMALQALVPRP